MVECSMVWTDHSLIVYPIVDGHLGYFQLEAITNSVAMSFLKNVFFSLSFFSILFLYLFLAVLGLLLHEDFLWLQWAGAALQLQKAGFPIGWLLFLWSTDSGTGAR